MSEPLSDIENSDQTRSATLARSVERSLKSVERRLRYISPMFRGAVLRAMMGKAHPRGAIKAMCVCCVGEPVKPGIRECGDRACPLWHCRPYQKDDEDENETPQA